MSGTVSAQLVFITAAMIAGILCMGPTPANAVFQPTLGIAAKPEVGVVEQVNGRRRYYRSYGYPYTILLHGATTALRVPAYLSRILSWCAVSVLPTVVRALLFIAESIGLLAPCKFDGAPLKKPSHLFSVFEADFARRPLTLCRK